MSRHKHRHIEVNVEHEWGRCWMAGLSRVDASTWTARAYITGLNETVFVGYIIRSGIGKGWSANGTLCKTQRAACEHLVREYIEGHQGDGDACKTGSL